MSIKSDWFGMDHEERIFSLRIYQSGHASGEGFSCYSISGEALWKTPEKLGFLECIGSYKWAATDKMRELVNELLF